jgi:hypothetical protein
MAAPCNSCGATKTEPVPGVRHKLARSMGFELRKCARCRRFRLLKKRLPGPNSNPAAAKSGAGYAPFNDPDGFNGCPRCGIMAFYRARRKWFERLMRRPPMARCADCGYRFPVPQV